ncbi:CDP-glycerol glycerophosphotransferase [Haemophilus influenzae]|uniref:CDP-glycerol glycerophosphotransferase n=1 Tax=Haemophilus influenzae TaxID=727 RepID=UPI0010C58D82|nr:CDP-glycerol glycerophosphotransferase [Haemophilus influenzae]VTP78858.1 serotype B capsulation protein [Haemophilus influenzae]
MTNTPYFIYLDTKIIGAVEQTITFFEHGVFPRENTTVLVKKYKHKSAKIIERALIKASLSYHFVNVAYLDALTEGVIFYPFNAKSNCRAVANRKLTHIFITHGESNKITSVKPITRIYDHVITAGKAGVDRFLSNKIFSQYDVDTGRIIPMGDTFIGKTGLDCTGKGTPVIFYAPTWEGGIEQENYSSIAHINQVVATILQLSEYYQVKHVAIRPHPNTGHRLPKYHQFLIDIVEALLHKGLKITLYKPHVGLTFFQAWKLRREGVSLTSDLSKFYAPIGLCDISAVESQLLNENIFYYLFCSKAQKEYLISLKNSQYYKTNILTFGEKLYFHHIPKDEFYRLRDYMVEQNYLDIPFNQRIEQLLAKLNQL